MAEEVLEIYREMKGQIQRKAYEHKDKESGYRDHRAPILGY
jgi:hypothetical protein